MNADEITFNIPDRFSDVRRIIGKFQEGPPDVFDKASPQCRLTVVEADHVYFAVGDNVYGVSTRDNVFGCLAGRFNIHIYYLLDAIHIFFPRLRRQVASFKKWLEKEREAYDAEHQVQQLREKAIALGYAVIPIEDRMDE